MSENLTACIHEHTRRAATVAFYNQLLRNVDIPGTEGPDGKMISGMDILDKLGVLKAAHCSRHRKERTQEP
jgi:hypothetical protein